MVVWLCHFLIGDDRILPDRLRTLLHSLNMEYVSFYYPPYIYGSCIMVFYSQITSFPSMKSKIFFAIVSDACPVSVNPVFLEKACHF